MIQGSSKTLQSSRKKLLSREDVNYFITQHVNTVACISNCIYLLPPIFNITTCLYGSNSVVVLFSVNVSIPEILQDIKQLVEKKKNNSKLQGKKTEWKRWWSDQRPEFAAIYTHRSILTVSGYFPKYGWWQAHQRLSVCGWIKNNESASLL